MLEFSEGKLVNNNKGHKINSIDFDGVTYKLPEAVFLADDIEEVEAYKKIVMILAKKYLKPVKD